MRLGTPTRSSGTRQAPIQAAPPVPAAGTGGAQPDGLHTGPSATADANARTRKLPKAAIQAMHAQLLAERAQASGSGTAIVDRRHLEHLRRRDRVLRVAVILVGMTIVAVLAAIVWAVVTTPEPHALSTRAPDARTQEPIPPPPVQLGETVPDGDVGREAEAPPEASRAPARVRVVPPEASPRFRLYVDGRLYPMSGPVIELAPGRHAVRARLLPDGTYTPERVLVLRPGEDTTLRL